MQLLYARVTKAIAGASNFRENAEIAFTGAAETPLILKAIAELGIGSAGPSIETSLSKRSKLAGLPEGRLGNDPDWSSRELKLWVLNKW